MEFGRRDSLPDDPMGPFLVIRVNGQRIFCRGGSWGMDDALKRVSRGRLEPYIRMHRDAHLTMIRNWCGQSTEEAFYDLCDEYGILVWNDFWMSTEGWNYPPADSRLMLDNVADTIKRYRNHPSIAIWCGRNEGIPPDDINEGIDQLVRRAGRHALLSAQFPQRESPRQRPVVESAAGEILRQVIVWFYHRSWAPAVPSAEVLRSMMAKEDLWPQGDVWAYHDFHSKGAGDRVTLAAGMKARYGEPGDLDDFCRKCQLINYETWRAIYEGHMAKLWNPCSGVLAWMSHPSWPSVVWQFYTWDYEPAAALFAVQKACEPIHVQMNLPDDKVVVINHTLKPLENLSVTARFVDLRGKTIGTRSQRVTAAANAVTDAFTLEAPAVRPVLRALGTTYSSGRLSVRQFLLERPR